MDLPGSDNKFQQFKVVIAEQLGVDESKVTSDAEFAKDLGADSLTLAELIMTLEEEFKIDISDEIALKLTTVGEAYDYVLSHSSGAERAADEAE
ncbi:MAG: acyl carrier protein [Chloroflexi bacterium]|jgi:acyl carrier protein|nr:acyl carrier protein [Chloroflexota bacterium]